MTRKWAIAIGGPALLAAGAVGCVHVKTDPIKVEPIHIVADINVRVQRDLDDFYSFEKKYATTAPAAAATTPAPTGL